MATEVSASFQDTTGGPINAYYAAQNQRMSMMEKAQTLKQQEIASRIMQQKQAEWEVQAPIRQKQAELNIAETGVKLYAANAAIEEEKRLVENMPTIKKMFDEARVIEKNEEGEPDYIKSMQKWYAVLSEVSLYGNSDRGKQLLDAAKIGVLSSQANYKELMEYNIGKLNAQQKSGELKETIINGKLAKINPQTGETAPVKGLYADADESRAIEAAKYEGREAGKTGVQRFQATIDAGAEAATNMAKLRRERQVMEAARNQMGAGFKIELGLRSVGQALGWGDEKTLSNMQQLQQMNSDKQLLEAKRMRGQGSITEGERVILAGAINNPNMSYESNMAILNVFEKIYARDQKISELAIELKGNNPGWSDERVNLEIAKWKMRPENQLDLTEVYQFQAPSKEANPYYEQRRAALKQSNTK